MLARRLTTILPAITLAEAIETTRIHRVAGLTGDRTAWVTTRPCRAPHHTLSDVGLIGGGHVQLPGEGSRTHQWVPGLSNPSLRWFPLAILFTDTQLQDPPADRARWDFSSAQGLCTASP